MDKQIDSKMKTSLPNLLIVAENAARAAGVALGIHRTEVLKNVGKDIKISADLFANSIVIEHLRKTNISLLSEEAENHDFSLDFQWVIDPLDGSINFLRGIPNSAISISLVKRGEPVLGVVYDFNRDEMYSGIIGKGAWMNGNAIAVSDKVEKSDAIIMTGFPSYTNYSTEALEKYISNIQSFKKVRLIGSASLSLAYVACGKADAYYERDIKIWDVAAGLALVKAAGGDYITTKIDSSGGCVISATNNLITKIFI